MAQTMEGSLTNYYLEEREISNNVRKLRKILKLQVRFNRMTFRVLDWVPSSQI